MENNGGGSVALAMRQGEDTGYSFSWSPDEVDVRSRLFPLQRTEVRSTAFKVFSGQKTLDARRSRRHQAQVSQLHDNIESYNTLNTRIYQWGLSRDSVVESPQVDTRSPRASTVDGRRSYTLGAKSLSKYHQA
ncbi:hypothetical protein AG1IA_03707 [Rhizoctonia solani AG-1 IA]|uniref:Uncharacterized protein n=1 Tax=Thanatephorus cucumeris (strain AG1-IA) TaxID=983506 RepID=L8WZL4_THACA|nr:hypothetical protein AG1IA_03707 [Rhizoctonia solani AG-1 IA]